jgi:aryl-alcohol dehydrogenase-like predicted oxidoreductase
MHGLNALVGSGKVRYIGLSDCPAWYVARAQTLAEWRGWEPLAVCRWNTTSPNALSSTSMCHWLRSWGWAFASGVRSPADSLGQAYRGSLQEGRLKAIQGSGNPVFDRIVSNPRNWEIVAALNGVAEAIGRSPAQVALNWITKRPGVSATLIGATKLDQLRSNLEALDFSLPAEAIARLEEVSRPELTTPYMFFGEAMQAMQRNGTVVRREPEWFRG